MSTPDPAASVLEACTRKLRPLLDQAPLDWVVVGGSGIGAAFGDGDKLPPGFELEAAMTLQELGLPSPSVKGHAKSLVFARVNGRRVALQTGRLHPYEGHHARVCTAALSALLASRPKALLLTCAVGALREDLRAGQLILLRDQIGLWGPTALHGAQFIDCSELYNLKLRALVAHQAKALGMPKLDELVYVHARGPSFETPAEVAALRSLGGDVVGMSTTYEATLGQSFAVPVAGLGLVTNSAGSTGLSHEEVAAQGEASRAEILRLMTAVLGQTPA